MNAISEVHESIVQMVRYKWPGLATMLLVTTSMTFLLFSPAIFLPDLEGNSVNIYSVSGGFFMAYVNVALWAKLHNQRLERYKRAEAWVASTYKMAVVLFLAAFFG